MPKLRKQVIGLTTPFIRVGEKAPAVFAAQGRAPTTSDTNFNLGDMWIYNSISYQLTNIVSGSATWSLLGPGSSDVDTLTGDAGGAISPAAGNITLAGGTNIGSTGAGSTITFNLDPAITLATSVTSPSYLSSAAMAITSTGALTITSGAATAITTAAGTDITIKMGDAAGANKVSFVDSASVEVFSIDSNGGLPTIGGALTVTGLITGNGSATINTAGAALNLGTDNAAGAVNIGTGTTIRAIGIGNAGGVAHTVAIGSAAAGAITVDTAAGISLDAATASNFTVTGAADLTVASSAGGVNITSGEAATATGITLDATAADGGVTIDAGTGGVNIATTVGCTVVGVGDIAPTASRTITVGGGTVVTAAVTDTIDIGPDGATTNANSIKTVNVNTGGVTLGQVLTNIGTGAITSGTHTVSIQTGNAAAGTVATNISTGTGTKTVTVGGTDALTTTALRGPVNVNASINANTAINSGTSTGTVTIGNAAAGAITVDTAAGISLDAATASNITVSAGALDIDSSGQLQINSSGSTIDIGNDAVAQNMNIGTGAAARTITIGNNTGASSVVVDVGTGAASFGATATAHTTTLGSTTGASSTVIQSGTGDITMTGTVKQIDAELIGTTGVYVPSFTMNTMVNTAANTGGAATGATGDVNNVALQDGHIMQEFVIGAGQTILQPIMGANGLIISGDQTNTEGYEYNFGVQSGKSLGFTIGTSAAFFFELGLYINDMDGAAPYVFGFRKVEANNATFANYTDYATIGMIAASSITNIVTATELNSGGQTVTDTTDAWGGDGTTNTLKVLVSAAGVVTYTINGSAPSVAAAFTFDNGDFVIPFIRITHSASPTSVAITKMRIGFQA